MTLSRWLGALALGGWAASLAAQTMPQDNWRYNQHEFSSPSPANLLRSVAIGSGGVYVGEAGSTANSSATRVLQFTDKGVFVRRFGASFAFIAGITTDATGTVYILDVTNASLAVIVFDQDGNFLRRWRSPGSGDGQFGGFSPNACSHTSMVSANKSNEVFVCDPGNSRVQVFDSNGNFLRKWGQLGELPAQFEADQPKAIAVSDSGKVYVGRYQAACSYGGSTFIRLFDSQGNYMTATGTMGQQDGNSLAVASDGLVFADLGGWNSCCSSCSGGIVLDSSFASVSVIGVRAQGAAFSKRGDLYAVSGTKVRIYEREYSSVQSPPTPPALPEPIVLGTAQRTNTAWLDVDYQVTHADGSNVTVAALAFVNGGNTLSAAVPMSTFMENTATNLGANVPSNTQRRFTWNMGADWSIDFAQIQVEVLAKDNRNLMGFHWITVPSDGTNPAIQVSSAPVPE